MDILKIIKERKSIRKYQDKPIPKEIINKIIEAGIWGPSVPSFLKIQPFKFVVVTKKEIIAKISSLLEKKSLKVSVAAKILLKGASNIINAVPVVVFVYKTKDLENSQHKFKEVYLSLKKVVKTAQISAISAAIQNMILTAEKLGVGSCWLDIPLFCEQNINKVLNNNNKLIAVLTLGYPAEKGKRSPRKPYEEAVEFIT
ncbi:MAG: nitroreductase family protein [Candidatus Omnitrophota bacterium]